MAESPTDLGECNNCTVLGDCCHFKVNVNGAWFLSDIPCPYLDQRSRLCSRFETRHEVPWCSSDFDVTPMPTECAPHCVIPAVRPEPQHRKEINLLTLRLTLRMLTGDDG